MPQLLDILGGRFLPTLILYKHSATGLTRVEPEEECKKAFVSPLSTLVSIAFDAKVLPMDLYCASIDKRGAEVPDRVLSDGLPDEGP